MVLMLRRYGNVLKGTTHSHFAYKQIKLSTDSSSKSVPTNWISSNQIGTNRKIVEGLETNGGHYLNEIVDRIQRASHTVDNLDEIVGIDTGNDLDQILDVTVHVPPKKKQRFLFLTSGKSSDTNN